MELKLGKGSVDLPLDGYETIFPKELPPLENLKSKVKEALYSLEERLSNAKKISIIVSDITRPVPTKLFFKEIWEMLREKKAFAVFGLGTHREQTPHEARELLGGDYPYINHDVNRCRFVGRTSYGTEVEVLEEVLDSDLIIATGNIEYHYFAGYTGGAKAILPGVSSIKTIAQNHSLMLDPSCVPGSMDGAVRKDMDEAGALLSEKTYLFNVVLNTKKEIVGIFSGDLFEAHRKGTYLVDSMYKVKASLADMVVASCGGFPKDINLYQAHKALENAALAVKDGGIIILLADCLEGVGHEKMESWLVSAKTLDEPIERLRKEGFQLGPHKVMRIALIRKKARVFLVSKSLPDDFAPTFFELFRDPKAALDKALAELGSNASVLVMPYAGSTLPDTCRISNQS
ncbi:MAG: nickel-dependent lactate racemase [Synergistetes bacterium]|nr:nickel-dependent lactate racemase [Synergistota bacterium]MCX8127610.1 nickel-dependent lactate racemase [Synergistota bacterium]MDW8191473.1 nickel-dependent lactate racemase [Synergistota bacterium]